MRQTPFLPELADLDLWRSPVNQNLILSDLQEFCLKSKYRPKSTTLDLAIARTTELFRLPEKVKMIHLNDTICDIKGRCTMYCKSYTV